MASYNPPLFNSSIFNAEAFVSDDTILTLEQANDRYLTKSFPTGFGNLTMSGSIKCTYLTLGTSTDTARMISALNNTLTTGNSVYFCLGRENNTGNQAEINFYYDGSNSTINRLGLGFHGGEKMSIMNSGRVGIGTTNPSTFMHINDSVSTSVSLGTYAFGTSGGYNGTQLAPVSFNNSLRTISSIYCGGSLYVFSDKRTKKDIEIIADDYSDRFFDNIDIITYRLKNEDETHFKKIGVIAQDLLRNGYNELINIAPNDELEIEEEGDIKGFALNVDYAKIALLCAQQIKKLKNELEQLKNNKK